MNFLGEYERETKVLLELNIRTRGMDRIDADDAPTVTVEHFDGESFSQRLHAPMRRSEDGHYVREHFIGSREPFGDFTVTYRATIGGKAHEVKERFRVVETNDFIQRNNDLLELVSEALGAPHKDKTTVYETLTAMKAEIAWLRERLKEQEMVVERRVKVTSESMLLPNGSTSRVFHNNYPLPGATVNAYVEEAGRRILSQSVKTDDDGKWEMMLYAREYVFEFVHPNRRKLYSFRGKV